MKLLLDQNLSRKLVPHLDAAFPGTTHVLQHALEGAPDTAIWEFAKQNGFMILTKDDDFQVLSFSRGHPPKVIWLRNSQTGRKWSVPTSSKLSIASWMTSIPR